MTWFNSREKIKWPIAEEVAMIIEAVVGIIEDVISDVVPVVLDELFLGVTRHSLNRR